MCELESLLQGDLLPGVLTRLAVFSSVTVYDISLKRVLSYKLSVQFSRSVVSDSLWLHGLQHTQASLSITNSWSLLKLMFITSVMPSNHLTLSCPLLLPLNLSQHQGLFQWGSSSHHLAQVLEFQVQLQSFQWIFRTDFLYDWLVGSPCYLRDSQ